MSEGFINTFAEYQDLARQTAVYPEKLAGIYPVLGLCGEAGEVAEKIKKLHRDKGGVMDQDTNDAVEKELGDVLWYLANIASDYGMSLQAIAEINIDKLRRRKTKGTLQGSGDNR